MIAIWQHVFTNVSGESDATAARAYVDDEK